MKHGIIGIEGLAISCTIGCIESERAVEQTILLDCRIECDFSVIQDALETTVDYVQVADLAHTLSRKNFYLIETFAMQLAEAVLATFSQVTSCFIRIKKPRILKNVQSCFVEYEARKQ